jgi:hypothetical protein
LMAYDKGVTVFDGWVGVAAKKALRTQRRIQAAIASRRTAEGMGRESRRANAPK